MWAPRYSAIEGVWRCTESRVVLDPASQPLRSFLDIGSHEAGIQHESLHICAEANRSVNVRLDALVEIVEARIVGHPAKTREQSGVSDLRWLQDRVREAER